jgi:hypothetical protein
MQMFNIHPVQFEVLFGRGYKADPAVIKQALEKGYDDICFLLGRVTDLARNVADEPCESDSSDYGLELEQVEGRVQSFVDYLQRLARQTRFVCYLFLQLPEDTLDLDQVAHQRCALDILWLQLDGFLPKVISRYSPYSYPKRWFAVLTTFLSPLQSEVTKWKDQLHIDLAHLNQPDATAHTPTVYSDY